MVIKLYDRCIKLASHKFSKPILAFIAFIESSIFPIPPDAMIVPMVIGKKNDYIKIFLITTIFSVLGGIFGYYLGYLFLELSVSLMEVYNYQDKVIDLQNKLSNKSGFIFWVGTLFLAGFTPLPYKVFTITSGIINFNIFYFILISLISRGLRFFIVSYISMRFGEKSIRLLEEHGTKWFSLVGIIVVLISIGIYLYYF